MQQICRGQNGLEVMCGCACMGKSEVGEGDGICNETFLLGWNGVMLQILMCCVVKECLIEFLGVCIT